MRKKAGWSIVHAIAPDEETDDGQIVRAYDFCVGDTVRLPDGSTGRIQRIQRHNNGRFDFYIFFVRDCGYAFSNLSKIDAPALKALVKS